MPWTETTRKHYEGETERYSSDATDEEWALISPLLPGPNRLGSSSDVELRDVWDAINIAAAGCAWAHSSFWGIFSQQSHRQYQRRATIFMVGATPDYWQRSTAR